MEAAKTVWLLTLTYRYGTENTLYASEAEAIAARDRYVADYWEAEFDEEPMPADAEEAFRAYCEASEDWIDIEALPLP